MEGEEEGEVVLDEFIWCYGMVFGEVGDGGCFFVEVGVVFHGVVV